MKEYFIERRKRFLRIAAVEDKVLRELYFEELNNEPQPGEIYKGIVKNIVPAIKCAFIDIGFEKHCFMYLDKKFNNLHIKKNDEVIVEVLKEAIGDKGPKVTNAFTIPGRYAVIETLNKTISFSKKIASSDFKHQAVSTLKVPGDVGVMVRTNAEKVSLEIIQSEIDHLYLIYNNLLKEHSYSIKPKLLYRGEGILDKVLRDNINELTAKIIVDDEKDYTYIKEFLSYSKYLNIALIHHKENRTLFSFYGLEKAVLELKNNKVNLESGGTIVIDKTEGMYVIDVNSGGNVKLKDLKATAYSTNLEAAKLIPQQVKLRNLGGIIIVDFIDMEDSRKKAEVLNVLIDGFKDDKNKTTIFPFTELNLIQIARNRKGKPLSSFLEDNCQLCKGSGKKFNFNYLKSLIENDIKGMNQELNIKDIYIEMDVYYKDLVMGELKAFAADIGAENNRLYVKFLEKSHNYKVEPLIFPNIIEKMQNLKIYG
jgi:ribonuclease G